MKKGLYCIVFLLPIFICFQFTACGESEKPVSFDLSGNISSTNDIAPQNICTITNYCQGFNAEGYYHLRPRSDGTHNLCFIDYDAKQNVILCNRLECRHDDETCNSWIGSIYNVPRVLTASDGLLLIYPGNAIAAETDDSIYPHIDRLDFNGTNRRTLLELDPLSMFADYYYAIADNTLYYQLDLYQDTQSLQKRFCIESLDLSTGKCTRILEKDSDRSFLMGACSEGLVIKDIQLMGGQIDSVPNVVHTLSLLDFSSGRVQELLSWKNDEKIEFIGREKLYYVTNEHVLHAVDYTTQEDQVVAGKAIQDYWDKQEFPPDTVLRILFELQDKLVFQVSSIDRELLSTNDHLFYVDLLKKAIFPLSFDPQVNPNTSDSLAMRIVNVTERYLTVIRHYRSEEVSTEENGEVVLYTDYLPEYALLGCDSFFDDKEDFLTIQNS